KNFIQQLRTSKRILQVKISDFRKNPPIFVYSMPKSGTSTIWMTLGELTSNNIYKLHRLSDEGLMLSREKRKTKKMRKLIDITSVSFLVREKIDQNPDVCWQIVTSTREPVAQAISELFQGIGTHHPYLLTDKETVNVDKVIQFLQNKLSTFDEHEEPEKSWYSMVWFDWELNPLFDVDVYSQPYRHDQGYMIFQNSRARVLLVRAEDLNRSFNAALKEFLNRSGSIEMRQANLASNKEYREEQKFYDAYRYVKSHFKVPYEVCEKIYSTKYARHFYTEEERASFIKKWSSSTPVTKLHESALVEGALE
ncbi:MAG: putative capsular polysaccharide synthesis family protein, partial [Cyanobacteria bacterium P01_E01_bin.6]